jgi:hypothetical protein
MNLYYYCNAFKKLQKNVYKWTARQAYFLNKSRNT